jgi:hypothetical protein
MDTVLAAPVAAVGVSVFEWTVRWLLDFWVWNEPNLLGGLTGVPQVQIINYERQPESGVQVV